MWEPGEGNRALQVGKSVAQTGHFRCLLDRILSLESFRAAGPVKYSKALPSPSTVFPKQGLNVAYVLDLFSPSQERKESLTEQLNT